MNKTWLPWFIVILYLSICIGSDMKYVNHELKEMEELRLSSALNYCSDAAAESMLETDDLGADYKDLGNVKVNPQLAIETFVDLFMINYSMSITEENRQYVMSNYMPTFTVAAYDGYYIAKHEEAYSDAYGSSYDLKFGPKLPYSYKPNGSSAYYALNMGGTNCIKLDGSIMTTLTSRPPGLDTKEAVIGNINSILTDAIGSAISDENKTDEGWSNTFYLPSNLTTFTGAQPVSGPSVMALVQNVDLTTGKKVSAFSIAGSRINLERMIAGYMRNGERRYSYVDKLPPGIDDSNAIDFFTNADDAAKKGFRCDTQFFE